MPSERPLVCYGPEVRAIFADLKTQLRRPMKPQPQPFAGGVHKYNVARHTAPYIDAYCSEPPTPENPRRMSTLWTWWTEDDRQGPEVGRCPFGKPGDRLWVREAHLLDPPIDGTWASIGDTYASIEDIPDHYRKPAHVIYRATCGWDEGQIRKWKWRSARSMPRWARRLVLEIVDVRVQRVQEISYADIIAEGLHEFLTDEQQTDSAHMSAARHAFAPLWDSINAKRGHPWESNPWVWELTFRRVGLPC